MTQPGAVFKKEVLFDVTLGWLTTFGTNIGGLDNRLVEVCSHLGLMDGLLPGKKFPW